MKENFNNKRKRIKEVFFNISTLEENNYLNINYVFLDNLNFNIYLLNIDLDDYNIFNIINKLLKYVI